MPALSPRILLEHAKTFARRYMAPVPDEQVPVSAPPVSRSLWADIDRLTSLILSRPMPVSPGSHGIPGGYPTPEELALTAAERDVEISYETRPLSSLKVHELPCVAMLSDGSSLIIVERHGSLFKGLVGGEPFARDVQSLAKEHKGVIFFVRPHAYGLGETDIPAEPEPTGRTVLKELLSRHRRMLAQIATTAILGNVLMFAVPMFSMNVYDRVIPHLAWDSLWALVIGVCIALCIDAAARYLRAKMIDAVGISLSVSLQARVFGRLLRAPYASIPRDGSTITIALRELDNLTQSIPSFVVGLAIDIPFFLIVLAVVFLTSGATALVPIFAVCVLVGAYYICHHTTVRTQRLYLQKSRAQNAMVHETLGSIEGIKAAGAEYAFLRRWESETDWTSFHGHRVRIVQAMTGQAYAMVSQLMIVMVLAIGVAEVSSGGASIGALSSATLLLGRALTPVAMLISLGHRISQSQEMSAVIGKILALRPEHAGDRTRQANQTIEGRFDFRNVTFQYPGSSVSVLNKVCLTIKPGEKIALIGRIGCGKTTLLRLMLRLLDPTDGEIFLDLSDIKQADPLELRRKIGFMRQEPCLIDDTVRANICMGLDTVTQANFDRAVDIAGVRDMVARSAEGFGMRVGPRGERLSGGERQAISLARALVADPGILILDEPTASMDNMLETRIVNELKAFTQTKTLLISTHRAPLLRLADRIIWLERGEIIADGPSREIMQRLNVSAA